MEQTGSQNQTQAPSTYLPTSFRGIGTRFFGKRDFRPDGTFLTTEFSVLGNLPVLPIRSVRVRYLGVRRNPAEPERRGRLYEIHQETKPNWIQVAYVYAYVVFVVWWLFFFGRRCDSFTKNLDEKLGALTIVVGFIWPAFIPSVMRLIRSRGKSIQKSQIHKDQTT
jgi:hypothetical protein